MILSIGEDFLIDFESSQFLQIPDLLRKTLIMVILSYIWIENFIVRAGRLVQIDDKGLSFD